MTDTSCMSLMSGTLEFNDSHGDASAQVSRVQWLTLSAWMPYYDGLATFGQRQVALVSQRCFERRDQYVKWRLISKYSRKRPEVRAAEAIGAQHAIVRARG